MMILITGVQGQLGSDIKAFFSSNHEVIGVDKDDFNITDTGTTIRNIAEEDPDVIIHSAAFTDVDACEEDPDRAFRVNSLGTRNVAAATRKIGADMVYISSDYVFGGEKTDSYREYDKPNPRSYYGKSKLLGEKYVREQLGNYFIFRTAWLYGLTGGNFVKTVLQMASEGDELRIVEDKFSTPTWSADVARQIDTVLGTDKYGTYHCTSQGKSSWFDFAMEIFSTVGYQAEESFDGVVKLSLKDSELKSGINSHYNLPRSVELIPVGLKEFESAASRPKRSVLDNYMLKLEDLDVMPHWKKSLHLFLEKY